MENIQYIISSSRSFTEVARKLGYKNVGGQKIKQLKVLLTEYDTSHFTLNGSKPREKIKKTCPICSSEFYFYPENTKKDKVTCSYACSNKMFRTAKNKNDNFLTYRTLCFKYHEKKCIICGEERIVEVHHYDGNHKNHVPENLIPLCPTHHQYMHSRYKNLIIDKVELYRKKIIF